VEIVPIKKLMENPKEQRDRIEAMCPYPLDTQEAITWFECLGTEEVAS
jgi:hypothetical protein